MEPTKKKGEIATVYLQWISKRGSPIKVELLEFVGTSHRQGRYQHGKPKPHYFEGKAYIGETWNAVELSTGKEVLVNFPHVIEGSVTPESSLDHRRDISYVQEVNWLLDSPEEVTRGMVNRTRFPNLLLKKSQERFNDRVEKLLELYKENPSEGLFLIIRHKQTPCLRTFNSVKEWRQQNSEKYQRIMDYISSAQKREMELEPVV